MNVFKRAWGSTARTAYRIGLFFVIASPSVFAGPQPSQITGIAHVAFRVSDLEKSRAFMHRLGFEEAFALTGNEKATEAFFKVNDRQFIEIYERHDSQPLGWMHVCFESNSLPALDDLYQSRSLDPSKVVKGGAGNLLFSLHDPEGRVVGFTQYMPGSRHTLDHGLHLGPGRISDELEGIEVPSPSLLPAQRFYVDGLGLVGQSASPMAHLRIADTDQWIALRSGGTDHRPRFIFRVKNVQQAARTLASRN